MSRLVIIGPPAAGKSSLGRRLARDLRVPFVDTDKRVEAAHGPIPTIFAEEGEAAFRRYERAAVQHALRESAVVSLGGGAILDPETQRDLAEEPVLLLTVTPEAAARRFDGPAHRKRPLVNGLDSWQSLVDARMPIYLALADGVIDTSHGHMQRLLDEVTEWLAVLEAAR